MTRTLTSLTGAGKEFARYPSPRLLAGEALVLLVTRLLWRGWSLADAIVILALLAANPFVEWLLHVYVLHCPADGGRLDRAAGYSHRRHHEEPRDLRFQFIHPYTIYGAMGLNALLLLAFRSPAAVTGVLFATVLTLVYEWVHFLIHTDYAPRHAVYRRLHRAHRLHHFRNERFWLGVTTRTADRVLGTNPRKEDVEVSPTAKTALAAR